MIIEFLREQKLDCFFTAFNSSNILDLQITVVLKKFTQY